MNSKDPEDLQFIASSMAMLNIWDKKIFHQKYQQIDKENKLFDKKFKEERKIYD